MASEAALFIRLYLDEDVFPDLAEAIRQRGFDCISAHEAGMLGRSDHEQLEYASGHGRCIFSFNVRDFYPLSEEWAHAGREHAGIVVTQHREPKRFGWLLRELLSLVNTITADEMRNMVLHF